MKHRVIAECVDRRTGKRHHPGEFFPSGDADQVQRLTSAGCLVAVSDNDLTADEKRAAAATRESAEAELTEIERTLDEARTRRDAELSAIHDELTSARSEADAEKLRINEEVATMQEQLTSDRAAIQRQQINEDGLFDKTVPELQELAEVEKIDLGAAKKKDDIVAAIRVARADRTA